MTDWLTDGKRAGCRVAHTQLKSKENLFFTGVFTCGYLKFNFSFYASFNSLQCIYMNFYCPGTGQNVWALLKLLSLLSKLMGSEKMDSKNQNKCTLVYSKSSLWI